MDQHLYLFTLEVTPMTVGDIHNPLPSHLTLVSRFWSNLSSEKLAEAVKPIFQGTHPIGLTFGEIALLGPQKVEAHLIEPTEELKDLHIRLANLLKTLSVTFTAPH